jgi:hypothetical protein
MDKKFILRVTRQQGKKGGGVVSVSWKYDNMTYPEMIGYLEIAKDRIKEKEAKRKK